MSSETAPGPAPVPTTLTLTSTPTARLAPLAGAERIEALDVVRGFALLGIFLMNIEWFGRPIASLREGMPRGLTGADWLAGWFVAYFVQGKFWTIFALLFGMGFAVMLGRAERAGRDFIGVYLRRILALAVFGAAHYLFLWDGDILFTYAVGALALLIVLYARPWPVVLAVAAFAGLGVLTGVEGLFAVAGGLASVGLFAIFLRSEVHVRLRSVRVPLFAFIVMVIGLGVCIAAVVFRLWPDALPAARLPLAVFGPMLVFVGWLAWRFREPASLRGARLGAGLFVLAAVAELAGGVMRHVGPDPTVLHQAAPAAVAAKAAAASATVAPAMPAGPSEAASATGNAAAKDMAKDTAKAKGAPKPTPAERAEKARAERDKRLAEQAADKAEEARLQARGSYAEWVLRRGGRFPQKVAGDAGFASLLVGVFLLGAAIVRLGVIDDTAARVAWFRRAALVGLPLGIGLGLAGSLIAMSHVPGDRHDGWGIAQGLTMLGNLPASLGWMALVVTLLHARSAARWMRLLAPMGRMALTNYLLQSLVAASVFYGYAMGRTDMPRAQQILFVLAVFAAQLVFSHWWLRRFRWGPVEWLWRGFTYREVPPMRLDAPSR